MPITLRTPIRRLSQAEFGEVAYSVMNCVFEIHSRPDSILRPFASVFIFLS